MSVQISFEFETTDAAAAFLRRMETQPLVERGVSGEVSPGKPEAPVVARRGRPPKNAQPAAETPKPDEQAKQTVIAAASLSDISEDQVQKALEEVFNAKGINVARELISKYDVKRLAELKREKFGEFIDHAKRVLAGEPV